MTKNSIPLIKKFFLTPFAWPWEFIYFLRRSFYDYGILLQKSFRVPIISIGNLTFGGTGKTPLTLWLADYLYKKKSKKVMILTRGYRSKFENKCGIIESRKEIIPEIDDYGDEALIFARNLEDAVIVVGKNRSQNLHNNFTKFLPDVVLLDDGHQHLKLKRNANIVLFDATLPLDQYRLAPLGYMREGFHALKDADLIVIGKTDLVSNEQLKDLKALLKMHLSDEIPIAEVNFIPKGLKDLKDKLVYEIEDLREKKVIAFSGIAGPESFFKSLEKLGMEVLVTEAFRDHHQFTLDELNSLLSSAKNEGAILVTTEKDIVRIKNLMDDELFYFLDVDLRFISGEDHFVNLVDQCMNICY